MLQGVWVRVPPGAPLDSYKPRTTQLRTVESNGILKYEYFLNTHFKTKKKARKAIEEAIQIYNTRRLHEKCGYKTPSAFREEAMRKAG